MRLDVQLIEEILAGKKKSFTILYHKYKNALYSVCLRYARDQSMADDFFQEGMIVLSKKLHHYDYNKGEFLPWARRVMANKCINMIRDWKLNQYIDDLSDVKVASFDVDVISKLSFDEMVNLVQTLPPGYQMVFNMFVMDGYSHAEIGKELNITVGTSKSQLSKAKKWLAQKVLKSSSVVNHTKLYG